MNFRAELRARALHVPAPTSLPSWTDDQPTETGPASRRSLGAGGRVDEELLA
ncbi:hypothetical protein ACFVZD_47040 [Streptomyces sp. NPDC058287]|uniref:hypothetical protein n=1 Tax=Streptomyces sp. NPDC058287 TaxID=3346423 RepID=UPI0036EB9089